MAEERKGIPRHSIHDLFANTKLWSLLALSFVLLVAGFLRFYQISTTEFDEDQAMLFRLAQDAVHYGLIPTTSNAASIGIANPPGAIYLLMPLALLGSNPILGAILVSLFATIAAGLTYLFTRRYYGPTAAIIAALLYATAAKPLNYARFIWQPNLMPPFVVLFFFALFLGTVERRKGWFALAFLLFGILYQLHPTAVCLAIPLLVALLLSPGTFRWSDLARGSVLLLVIFSPYLLWEYITKFADIHTLFSLTKQHANIDRQAFSMYWTFLSPFDHIPTYPTSIVRLLARTLFWLRYAMLMLTIGGFLMAILLLFRLAGTGKNTPTPHTFALRIRQQYRTLVRWWQQLRANPYHCGLVILLLWQIVPLLILSRHAVSLHAQYFFMLMPGPFILIGLFLSKVITWSSSLTLVWTAKTTHYASLSLATLLIVTQFIGSTAAVIDNSNGNYNDRSFQPYPYHNDLRSLQQALSQADQLSLQRHLNHIYVSTDAATQTALGYLSESMHTPTTLFDATHCLMIPPDSAGPAAMLVGPYDDLTNAMLAHLAHAHLISTPARLGGLPFRLYIITPTLPFTNSQATFGQDIQLLSSQTQRLHVRNTSWLVTHWSLLHAAQPALHTTYNYTFTVDMHNGQPQHSSCTFTSIRTGDELLVAFYATNNHTPAMLSVDVQRFTTTPYNPTYGPLHLETDQQQNSQAVRLLTNDTTRSHLFAK